jgi:DNA repair exonuclease SbcCD nuclease subunit
MKIALFSDLHLGLGKGTQRFEEAFNNAEKCFEIALENDVDVIVLVGDLFNESNPSIEVIQKAFQVFLTARKKESSVKIFHEKGTEKKEFEFQGIPIITIAGTHEFKGKDSLNILDVFHSSKTLLKLHASIAEIRKGNEKLFIHGLSGIPEKHALNALTAWNPKPISNEKNILLLHQSIKEFLPFDDEMTATISLNDLPNEFDLIVDGHLHWTNLQELDGKKFLLVGSTITTQMKKLEQEKPKGLYLYETESGELIFKEIPNQRKLFYHKINFNEAKLSEVLNECRTLIQKDLIQNNALPPLIRLKLVGTLATGLNESDINLNEILSEFQNKAIFSVSKNFSSKNFSKKIEELRKLHSEKKPISMIGFELLEKNLKETDFNNAFDAEKVFQLLEEGKIDEVIDLLEK